MQTVILADFSYQKVRISDQSLGHNIFWRNLTQNRPGGYVRKAELELKDESRFPRWMWVVVGASKP